jgi:hypothetical protein
VATNETSKTVDRPQKNPREKVRAVERLGLVPKVTTLTGLPLRRGDNSNRKERGRTGERIENKSLGLRTTTDLTVRWITSSP